LTIFAETQLAAGAWHYHGLVFASAIGAPLDATNVRREFRKIIQAASLGAASGGLADVPPRLS
jgi:hypothetical protein